MNNVKKLAAMLKKRRTSLVLLLVCLCCGASYFFADEIGDAIQTSLPTEQLPIIVIDSGHGGADGGCSTPDGVPEKGINLSVSLRLRDMLTLLGYETLLTRDTDISIHDNGIEGLAKQKASDMDNRLALFNKYSDAICLSIHQNQYTSESAMGAQIFYSDTNPQSRTLAGAMQSSFADILQPYNDREIKLCGKELFLCYFSENPTVMIECGFLSNPTEAAQLVTEDYQQQVAFTILSGLLTYLS